MKRLSQAMEAGKNQETLHEALGFTKERSRELMVIALSAYAMAVEGHDEVIKIISKTPGLTNNELVYTGYIYAKAASRLSA